MKIKHFFNLDSNTLLKFTRKLKYRNKNVFSFLIIDANHIYPLLPKTSSCGTLAYLASSPSFPECSSGECRRARWPT